MNDNSVFDCSGVKAWVFISWTYLCAFSSVFPYHVIWWLPEWGFSSYSVATKKTKKTPTVKCVWACMWAWRKDKLPVRIWGPEEGQCQSQLSGLQDCVCVILLKAHSFMWNCQPELETLSVHLIEEGKYLSNVEWDFGPMRQKGFGTQHSRWTPKKANYQHLSLGF